MIDLSLEQELDIHLTLIGGGTRDNSEVIKLCIEAIDNYWSGSDDLILLPEFLRQPNVSYAVADTTIIDAFKLNYWLPEWAT